MATDTAQSRSVLERLPAGGPRGSWPAEEYAAAQRALGTDAQVVMDLGSDQFLVVGRQVDVEHLHVHLPRVLKAADTSTGASA